MRYYNFNIGDYKSHTEHLSDFEDLAYRRMLDWYYLHEMSLPLEIGDIARLIRMRSHTDSIETVLREFFVRTATGWVNARADQEIERAGEKSAKASESARHRWDKIKDAAAMRTHSEGNAANAKAQSAQGADKKKARPARRISADIPDDVDKAVWDDFISIRKAKRAPLTETALRAIEAEAHKAGWTLEAALRECAARGWQGFKAEWVKDSPIGGKNRQEALEARNRAVAERYNEKLDDEDDLE